MTQQIFGDAAEERVGDPGAAVGADDEKIRVDPGEFLVDDLAHQSLPQGHVEVGARHVQPSEERRHLGLGRGAVLLVVLGGGRNAVVRKSLEGNVVGVHQMEGAALDERGGILDGALGEGRKIACRTLPKSARLTLSDSTQHFCSPFPSSISERREGRSEGKSL